MGMNRGKQLVGKTKEEGVCYLLVLASASRSLRFDEFPRYFPETSYIMCQYWMVSLYIYRHQSNEAMRSPGCSVSVHNFLQVFRFNYLQNYPHTLSSVGTDCISHTLSAPSRPQRLWGVTNCWRIIHAESAINLKLFLTLCMLNVCSTYAQCTLTAHSRSDNIFCVSIQMYLYVPAQCHWNVWLRFNWHENVSVEEMDNWALMCSLSVFSVYTKTRRTRSYTYRTPNIFQPQYLHVKYEASEQDVPVKVQAKNIDFSPKILSNYSGHASHFVVC
jgi:hypothetical protein